MQRVSLCVAQTSTAVALRPSSLTSSVVASQQRNLRFAKTTFGYRLPRRGQRKFPAWRQPFAHSKNFLSYLKVPYHWKNNVAKDPNRFLPKANYITGEWTGLFAVPTRQVFTVQHATCGVPIRIRRFPTFYTFSNPSRWLIGKHMSQWAVSRARIVDEATISKRQRLVLVKRGLVPKE